MKGERLKIAFIGCGRISAKHFDALQQLEGQMEVCALCDIAVERAQHLRSAYSCCASAALYSSVPGLLAQKAALGLQLAVLALPNGLHAAVGMQCARAGLHIIVEKPLAVRLDDGIALVQSCREYQVELFLIHQNRFNAPVQSLYQALAAGRLGRIYSLYANVFWTRPQSYYDEEGSWHGTKDMDGGAFYTQASHYVDLLQWLVGGPPRRVWSQLRTLARNIETEDCGTAFLEWEHDPNHIIATINVSMLCYPKNLEGSLLILGEKGSVKIGGTALNQIEIWQLEDEADAPSPRGSVGYQTDSVYGFGHQNLYAAIAARFRREAQPQSVEAALICGESILDNLRILDAIQRSARENGRIVEL